MESSGIGIDKIELTPGLFIGQITVTLYVSNVIELFAICET